MKVRLDDGMAPFIRLSQWRAQKHREVDNAYEEKVR